MSKQKTNEEWVDYIQQKLFNIIDNSNDLYDIFEKQGEKDKEIIDIYTKTNHFEDISADEIAEVSICLSNLIFATPLNEDYFYVHTTDGREMIFFTNYDELKEYREKNNNCLFVYLKLQDLITLIEYFDLEIITVFFTKYVLNFPSETIENFYNIAINENMN
ncbi:MAG: hypothetical protein IJX17_03210 [Clostridia bacterium]|nr:hypothetical protein [Clostridia bacterium]